MPPHTDVEPLTFDDVPFEVEHAPGAACELLRLGRHVPRRGRTRGGYVCSDTEWCARVPHGDADLAAHAAGAAALLPDPHRDGCGSGRSRRVGRHP